MASKLDQLKTGLGGNAGESLGKGRTPARIQGTGPVQTATDNDDGDRHERVVRTKSAVDIPLDRIFRDPDQPREEFDAEGLARLAESLKTRGQLQPIRVRWDQGRGSYVIVCGERRWRAAALAGLGALSCVIHEGEVDILAVQLIENALREDLKPVEQARAFRTLIERNNWGPKQLADELAIDPAKVTRMLALLTLPEEVQEQVEQGTLAATTAYEVSRLPDPAGQVEIARAIIDEGLTRTEAREAVRSIKARRPAPAQRPEPVAVDLGDCTVTVRWKRPSPLTASEAFRLAAERTGREQVA